MTTPEHIVRRLPWEPVGSGVLPALEQAREQASLEPLKDWIDVERLDASRYILTGRKYLLFGAEQHTLFGGSELLLLALDRLTEERLDLEGAGAGIADALRSSGRHAETLALWEAVMGWDHNLPDWMTGHEGPSLVTPPEVARLREAMGAIAEEPRVASAPALAGKAGALSELLSRCGEQDGLAITAQASGASPTWGEAG